jgi:hypothetical protein
VIEPGCSVGPSFSKPAGIEAQGKLRLRNPADDDLAALHFSAEMSTFEPFSTSIRGAFL